jgi:hypothetical protein
MIPAVARAFGWNMQGVQQPFVTPKPCDHSCTDGTIDCPDCGITVAQFISEARCWLDDHDGATADDPGYFA